MSSTSYITSYYVLVRLYDIEGNSVQSVHIPDLDTLPT
jgi:hypothetical protein